MSAEVFEEVAYVADCEACGYKSELFETIREPQRDAEKHDEYCTADSDPRTEREKWQDALDASVARAVEAYRD